MDLPVDEWKSYVLQKWSLLPESIQVTISSAKTLSEIFLHSSSLLRPEDETFLERLSRGYLVGKDPSAPPFYREEGNRKFQEKDYAGAAVLYSKGVSHSRPNTEDCSLCYANRSAALFHLGHYQTCLEDIIRAQMHGYPERLQPKLTLRKAECLVTLGRLKEASHTISALELESDLTAKSTSVVSPLQNIQKNLCLLKRKIQEKENLPETFPTTVAKHFEDRTLEENKNISNASSSVALCMDLLKGRHLIATKDILPGELLVKEEAFVSVLNPGEMSPRPRSLEVKWDTRVTRGDLYCHKCLKHTLATLPCDGCSYARYCSQECAQQAWALYHSTECSIGGLLLTLGIFCHVALRLTLLSRFEDVGNIIQRIDDEINNKDICLSESQSLVQTFTYGQGGSKEIGKDVETQIPGCDTNGKYENNYNAVFNLLPHTENHSPEHKFLCALSISALCGHLKADDLQAITTSLKSSKLKAARAPQLCADWNVWAVAMLRHLLQLQCNAQAVTTLQHTGPKESDITTSRQVRLATGVFPVISLLNHSCSPNTSVSFSGTVVTVRATQHIGKGQEILHCYGPHESRMDAAERRRKLRSQYFFDCSCPACHSEEGRTASGPRWEAFRCNSCRELMQGDDILFCGNRACTESASRTHLASRLRDLRQQVGAARKLLSSGQLERAIQQLLGCQQNAESFLSAEHIVAGEIEDDLAQAYAALGDWQKSATHLQKSLRVVGARHGPSSVEMGHELFKLAQVLFNGFAIPEALNAIQKAEKVLLMHYGPQSDEIQELQKMRSCLLDLPPTPVGLSG
ncbi:SET and MYND domain-containing protein 4 [Ctenodactylus gundi]